MHRHAHTSIPSNYCRHYDYNISATSNLQHQNVPICSHANMSINRCVYSQFYHPPSACAQHLQRAPQHHFPVLLFFLHPDRMTAYIEKQNATSCQAENKTKQPICFGFIQEKKAQLRQQFGHIKSDIAHILVTWRRELDKTVNSIICCKVHFF